MIRFFFLFLGFLAMVGCASQTFPKPMMAQDVVRFDSGDALVAYLSQPNASGAVCDLRATGPHLSHVDDDVRSSLVRGLTEGRIEHRTSGGGASTGRSRARRPREPRCGSTRLVEAIDRS